jgi:hypothetical protein
VSSSMPPDYPGQETIVTASLAPTRTCTAFLIDIPYIQGAMVARIRYRSR